MEDDLLKKIQNAREVQEKIELRNARAKSESRVERMSEDVTMFHRFILQFLAALQWSFVNVGLPIWRVVRWPFWKLFKQYRRLWSLVVYQRDAFDNLRFSKVRAGILLTSTIFYLWFALVPTIIFVGDVVLYNLTVQKDEVIYLSFSQEIDPENNVHSVKGSESVDSDELNGFYFRVESSVFNQLWSRIHRNSWYYPDYVASAVPPGNNRCIVTSYGIRMKTFMKRFEIYPQMLSAHCRPVSMGEK